jgi:peptidoglycan hydrolase CwlO-like protein
MMEVILPSEGMEVDAVRSGGGGMGPEVVDLEEKRRLECLADMEKIEKEFQDLKEKFYQEKVEALRKEIDTIQSGVQCLAAELVALTWSLLGSHDKLQQKLKELEYKRDEKLWAARQWRE